MFARRRIVSQQISENVGGTVVQPSKRAGRWRKLYRRCCRLAALPTYHTYHRRTSLVSVKHSMSSRDEQDFPKSSLPSSNDNIASSSSVSRSLPPPDNNVLPVCVLLQGSPYRFDLSRGIEVMAERHEHFERVPERCVRRGLVPCLLLQAPLGARKALQ